MDLPAIARRPFTEVDGSVGKVVLVYPPETGISVWNGRDLLRIASVLQTIKLDNGKVIETSGFAVVFGSMIRSVLHDGPIATVASLIAVLIIIIFTIRPAAAALMALATLVLGVLLMMGGAGWAQRARDVPELHRAADHVRHRRGVRPERRHPLPRGAERRARGDLDGRGGGALLVDDDRRVRLVARGQQPGAERDSA